MADAASWSAAAGRVADHGYAVVPAMVEPDLLERVRRSLEPHLRPDGPPRLTNAWMALEPVAELAAHPSALALAGAVLGGRAVPFQTLDFRRGTEQRPHADTIHFDTVPTGGVCGVWVALEDVGPGDGPLVVYPGSHRFDPVVPASLGCTPGDFDAVDYEDHLDSLLRAADLRGVALSVSAGDAVVWAAGLVHGGAAIELPERTRWSQVTHYVRAGSLLVTPLASDVERDEYRVRVPLVDIGTRRRVRPTGAVQLDHRWNGRSGVRPAGEPGPAVPARVRSRLVHAARSLSWQMRYTAARVRRRPPAG